jgi:hypothetical protein
MTENLPAPAPALTLPAFTPVPRQKDRSNGWKPHVQQRFIEALAETGSVAAACRRVGRTDHGAYQLRRHPEAASFRAAWDAALDLGVRRIEDGAMDRALYGTEEVVVQNGKTVVRRRRFNERLVMFILRNRAPERFAEGGARGLSAVDKRMVVRLRKEWEAEQQAAEAEEGAKALEEIDAMLERMRRNRMAHMSPAQRAAQIAADAQARVDAEAGWTCTRPYRDYAARAAELLPRFIAEVEAEWPPLEPDDDDDDAGEPGEDPPIALPPPGWGRNEAPEAPPSGPRIRRITDDGW